MTDELNDGAVTISVKGRATVVPGIRVGDQTVIVQGRWLRIAAVRDEEWLAGQIVEKPESYIARIHEEKLSADIFTFSQKLPDLHPRYNYHIEWDNVAAISTIDFSDWWEKRVSPVVRKNVRRSEKRGLEIRQIEFSDELIASIVKINNETPIRQGRLFWHYGKSFDEVRKDYCTMPDRSEYIGAFFGGELVGFIKMIYLGETASILQLLIMNAHYDKRPSNALLARAVQLCHDRGLKFLTYGQYVYGNNVESPLTEFKRRNGFEQVLQPRYFVPLTLRGRIALRTGLHHGLKSFLPKSALDSALKLRTMWYERFVNRSFHQESA